MTIDEAKKAVDGIGRSCYIDEWHGDRCLVEGPFTADELEAIAVLMRANQADWCWRIKKMAGMG